MSSYLDNLRFSDRQATDISADNGLPPYENNTFVETFTETKSCAIGRDGIRINYDLDTATPKYFEMTKDGVVFQETGQPTYTTGLGRLCAVQQAFQAVELPPNSTTLQLDDTLKLTSSSNATTISPTGANIVDFYANTLYYKPQLAVVANSNIQTNIPSTPATQYEVFLKGVQVPLQNRLEAQPALLPTSETILCSLWSGAYQYIGCASGNVYWYDTGISSWTLLWTFDGEVRCMMYHSGKVYVGGTFVQLNYPLSVIGLYRVAYWNDTPYSTSISAIVFNTGGNGFNDAVNTITSDGGNYFYFGGAFTGDNNNVGYTRKIACYKHTSNDLENLDGVPYDTGFDGTCWNLQYGNGYLTATGEFQYITTGVGTTATYYCSNFGISNNNVGTLDYLFGSPTILTTPISTLTGIGYDGNYFYIPVNEVVSGCNYVVQAPYYSFASGSSVSANGFDSPIKNVFYNGALLATTTNGKYWSNGAYQLTLGSTNTFTFYNYPYSPNILFFYNGGDSFYGLTGTTNNIFGLNGRPLAYQDTIYYNTISIVSGRYGDCITLDWDGTWLRVKSYNGIGIIFT